MKHQKRGTATVKEKYRNVQVSPRTHAAIKAMAQRLDVSMGAVIARAVYERGLEDRICEP